jgi:hypothetical protein
VPRPTGEELGLYIWAPARTRFVEALNVVIRCSVVLLIIWWSVPDPWKAILELPLVVAVAALAVRGSRIQMEADADRLVVRNYWKVYVVPWSAVSEVELGTRSIANARQAALKIAVRGKRLPIEVHATPIGREGGSSMMYTLKTIAPPNVTFGRA